MTNFGKLEDFEFKQLNEALVQCNRKVASLCLVGHRFKCWKQPLRMLGYVYMYTSENSLGSLALNPMSIFYVQTKEVGML